MPVTSVRDFLRLIEKSNLLSAEQLAEFKSWPEEEPATLVARMVKAGWITEWQSQQLLAGKSQFFMGRYKLLDLIGVGGMGAVFKAMLPPFGRTVALKVMSKQLLKQPKSVTRFLREIRTAAAVDHPNLVRAYDADCDRDTYFLVMEFVSGRNLKSWIKTEKSLPIGWSCECIRQAALGLEHAFEQGMVHRDIKPSNLLVTEDAQDGLPLVKILDLGLARFASETVDTGDLTRSGQVLGTPDYIAPEQARNTKTADIRADIFSLGCTLFELLTGRLPFPGETVMEKLMARASQDAYHVRLFRPDVPVELDAVVAKMLARDPQMRFGTPADVAQALAPFAIGTSGDIPVTAPSFPAGPSTAGPPATTFVPLDVTTDTSLHGFPVDLTRVDTGRTGRPKSGSFASLWGQPRLRATAAVVVAVAVLFLAGTLLSGKKGSSTDDSSHEARPPKKHKKEPADGKEGPAIDLSSDEDVDPERATAKWILKQGGSLTVVALPHAGTNSQKGSSGRTREPAAETREVHDPFELPAGAIHVTGVALHGQIDLSKADIGRLVKLTRLESLNLADTRFIDADMADLQDAHALTHLDLQDTPTTDAAVVFLKRLPKLQSLRLNRTKISGAALEILKSLRSLTELHVEGTRIGDADLKHLRNMPQLINLNLARTDVKGTADRAIKAPALYNVWQLKELTTLDLSGLHLQPNALALPPRTEVRVQSLRLTSSRVNDDALKLLSGMSSLRELWLGSTAVTGEGMKQLTWLTNLEHLELEDTVVGDLGLRELGGLKPLKSLNLRGTVVSDAGLVHLRGLKGLRSLDLSGTKATEDGANALRRELPGCAIDF